jgi:hypothetical protein
MRAWLTRFVTALLTGYVFVFFSEISFWMRPLDSVVWPGIIGNWLSYSLTAYVFLGIVGVANPRRWAAVFLCGALFGWLVEGVLVATMYASLPFSISATGLEWHALLTVGAGWYLIPRALRTSLRATVGYCALVGGALGFWALTWWFEPGAERLSLAAFATFITVRALVLGIAYVLLGRVAPTTYRLNWGEWAVLMTMVVAWFALLTVPRVPFAPFILLPCVALTIFALWRFKRRENIAMPPAVTAWARVSGPFPIWRVLGVLALPAAASIVYALGVAVEMPFKSGIVVYLITVPLGFFLYIRAVVLASRRLPSPPPATTGESVVGVRALPSAMGAQ